MLRFANWADDKDRAAVRSIREHVFMDEQGVSAELEWDGRDSEARHLLYFVRDTDPPSNDGTLIPVATARILPDGHIGRMAVLRPFRGQGMGTEIIEYLLQDCRDSGVLSRVWLDAQVSAMGFYQRLDFAAIGDVFMDAGIEHRRMVLVLA